jgi:transcription elongation factor Elf1
VREKRKYADRPENMVQAVSKRRKKIREMTVEYKGGKCFFCGYSKYVGALDFHQVQNDGKDFGISDKGYTRSWQRVKQELDKCILVCANCHRELHGGILQLPKETLDEK